MPQIALSEPAYAEAARGQSIEEFVVEVVHLYAEDEAPLVLTPEQADAVRRAQEDVRAGRVVTLEAFDAHLAERREAWLRADPDAR